MSYIYIILLILSILLIIIPIIYYNASGNSYWYNWLILSFGVLLLLYIYITYILYETYSAGAQTIQKLGVTQETIATTTEKYAPQLLQYALA